MERFTPLYAIMNSMENLCFDKFSRFSFLYGFFNKRNRKHFPPCVPIQACSQGGSVGATDPPFARDAL